MPYKDPEARKAFMKAYYASNREKIIAQQVEHARNNPNTKVRKAKWAQKNSARIKEQKASPERRAARRLHAETNRERLSQAEAERYRRHRAEVTDAHIAVLFAMPVNAIPPPLLSAKRKLILIKRKLKELK